MIFIPKDDITVQELADVVSGLMIIVPKEVLDQLNNEGVTRHFKEVPEQPRIMVPKW